MAKPTRISVAPYMKIIPGDSILNSQSLSKRASALPNASSDSTCNSSDFNSSVSRLISSKEKSSKDLKVDLINNSLFLPNYIKHRYLVRLDIPLLRYPIPQIHLLDTITFLKCKNSKQSTRASAINITASRS